MAVSVELLCETCRYEQIIKSSMWCTECQEGFCEECCRSHKDKKNFRNHNVMSTEDYQKTEKFNVNLKCPEHSKLFGFYCPTHDSVVCVVCVQSKHGGCENLRPIDEAAKGAKTSTVLTDLEQTVDGLFENIDNRVRYLQQNKTYVESQEDVVRKSIATKRAEINKHLERLEEKLLKELKSNSEKAVKEISLMTTKLETQRKKISDLKDSARHINQLSSNLERFVGIRSILKTAVKEINAVKLLVNSIPELSIAVQINPKFDKFTEAFDILGEIQITSKEAVVQYVERRLIQTEYQRPVHKLDNLQLKLRTNIKMGTQNSEVTSCLILPNKSFLIASWNKPTLNIFMENGSHDRDICVPYKPYDITKINDQSIAVSYGDEKCITIVNICNQRSNQTLENLCEEWIWGITYNDGKLYAVAYNEGIKVIDQDGSIIKTIGIYDQAKSTFKVTTQKDKIYYSVINGSVHCVNMEGTEIWTCQDDRLQSLDSPAIAVDNYGITFAAGYDNNLLLAISPDGKQQKVLLTSSDGLQKPNAVYYDKDSQRLLVCNGHNEHAALYDVIY